MCLLKLLLEDQNETLENIEYIAHIRTENERIDSGYLCSVQMRTQKQEFFSPH